MPHEFHYQRRVHFQDTDTAGLIHFSNYFRYMEETETEFLLAALAAAGVPRTEGYFVTPRVNVAAEFFKPVGFGDVLDCHLRVSSKGRSSVGYVISFWKDGEEVARGRVKFVCVEKDAEGVFRSAPIPPDLDSVLQVAPEFTE